MIDPNEFTKEMEYHWKERLKNVSSEALRTVWYQQAQVFGYYAIGDSQRNEWRVLQPPTGSGKTQGTVVYCSMLARLKKDQHPGALIVTRLKADADQIAEKINELSGNSGEAVAYHGDSKKRININDLKDYPVLVICHRAYELALDLLGQDGTIQKTWPFFYNWKDKNRRLVVIDEALDIVEHSQAALDGLRGTEGTITQTIRERFPNEVNCINEVIDILDAYEKRTKKEKIKEHRILESLIKDETTLDFIALRKVMREEIRYDLQLLKNDPLEQQRLRELHDGRIKDLSNIIKSWVYYARGEFDATINTARLLVPEDIQGAIILDATASSNVLYQLFKPAQVIKPPPGSRNYKNVNLHVSKGHRLGKRHMRNNAKELSRELIGELNEKLGEERKVFICTHLDVEPVLDTFKPKFNLKTGHWQAVDGSNEYMDCDTAVIFGLPYRPDTWPANVFMALKGPQPTEWLQQSDKRAWEKHEDIRKSLKNGQMITSIIQAINRVRCRRVIDVEGNCLETDIYLMLPCGDLAADILKGIKQEMPGIKIKDWTFSSTKRQPRRSNHESALIKFIKYMDIGRQPMSTVKKTLGIPDTTSERIIKKMKDDTSRLYQTMASVGVKYISQGLGKGKRAYLVKDWIEA
jgi:RAD3-like DEAD/DEAH box helicase